MFCFGCERGRKEKLLLHVAKETTCDSISGTNLVFKSFLEELCFWESSQIESVHGRIKHYCIYSTSHGNGIVFAKKQNKIPTMKEAIDMDNEYKQLTSVTNSSTSTLWGIPNILEAGDKYSHKNHYWKKVCNKKLSQKLHKHTNTHTRTLARTHMCV